MHEIEQFVPEMEFCDAKLKQLSDTFRDNFRPNLHQIIAPSDLDKVQL